MDDLRRGFASLDRMRAPDLWGDIELRAEALGSAERVAQVPVPIPVRSRGFRGRTAVVLLAAAALLVGLLAGAIIVGSGLIPQPTPMPSAPATPISTDEPSPSPASTPAVTIGRFVPAGSLVEGRAFHSALALPDGRVLVVGGQGSTDRPAGLLDSIEVWNPVGVAFTASGEMQRATYGDQSSAPFVFRMNDGRSLLMPAGCQCKPPPGSTPAQVWDPVSGARPLENLIVRTYSYTATQLSNGNILIAGGVPRLIGDTIAPSEIWDPVADVIVPTGPVGHARTDAVATLLKDGRVLILGGVAWVGEGLNSVLSPVPEAEVWDDASGTFSTAFTFETGPGYSYGRDQRLYALTLTDGRVLILDEAGARVWDPAANMLSEAGTFGEARRDFSATLLADGRVLVAGGSQEIPGNGRSSIASTELWSPSTGGFEPGPDLAEARASHSATLLSDGRVLIVGGFRTAGRALDALASAELWEPLPADGQ